MKVLTPALAALMLFQSTEAAKVSNAVAEYESQILDDQQFLNLDEDAPEDVELVQDANNDTKRTPKSFSLRSRENHKFWVYMSKQKEGNGYVLKLTDEKPDWRGVFFYDKQNEALRLSADPKYVLSNYKHEFKQGRNLIMEPVKEGEELHKTQKVYMGSKTIRAFGRCMAPLNSKIRDQQFLTYWTCHNLSNQFWEKEYRNVPKNDCEKSQAKIQAHNHKQRTLNEAKKAEKAAAKKAPAAAPAVKK